MIDIEIIKNWLGKLTSIAYDISEAAKSNNKVSIFTISSTGKGNSNQKPYLTPTRQIEHGWSSGTVVYTQTQAILAARAVDGIVDHIFVDAEKKISISFDRDEYILKYFNLKLPKDRVEANVHVELGNLSAACNPFVIKSDFHEYKPNDLTVDAVWTFLSNHFKVLSGKKIAIIGAGNIGFKLALKLVESGCSIELVRRSRDRGRLMADVMDIIKPQSTIAAVHYNQNPLQASIFCDALIGCTNGVPAISWEMVQVIKKNGIIIDVGKGSVCRDAIKNSLKNKIPIYRSDISSALAGVLSTVLRNRYIVNNQMGRRKLENGIYIVSGGVNGSKDDIIVDNFKKPSMIFGVADGAGDLKREINQKDSQNIKLLKKDIEKWKLNN